MDTQVYTVHTQTVIFTNGCCHHRILYVCWPYVNGARNIGRRELTLPNFQVVFVMGWGDFCVLTEFFSVHLLACCTPQNSVGASTVQHKKQNWNLALRRSFWFRAAGKLQGFQTYLQLWKHTVYKRQVKEESISRKLPLLVQLSVFFLSYNLPGCLNRKILTSNSENKHLCKSVQAAWLL